MPLLHASEPQPGTWVALSHPNPKAPDLSAAAHSASGMTLRVRLPGYYRRETIEAGRRMVRISLPDCPLRRVPGEPLLPFVSIPVRMPHAGSIRVECKILSHHTYTDPLPFAPAPPLHRHIADDLQEASSPGPSYGQNAILPSQPVFIGEIHNIGQTLETVLHGYPIRLNPVSNTLDICDDMELQIEWTRSALPARVSARTFSASEETLTISRRALGIEPEPGLQWTVKRTHARNMLVICADAFYDAMLPFVKWKRQKGIPTELVRLSDAGGSNPTNVHTFVKSYSETNGLTFLQLVGDAGFMPALPGTKGYMVGQLCDYRYALLEGNDMYPDIFVARFPAQNLAEVSNMVQRSVAYEKTPMEDVAWYHNGLGAASSDSAGGMLDYERIALIRSNLLAFTYAYVDHFYGTNISASQIAAGFNAGRSIANFIGHGDPVSWSWSSRLGGPQFNVGAVRTLTNTNMLPFVIVVGCEAGRYIVTNDCLAEAFMKAGSALHPIGGIGVYAAFDQELDVPPCTGQAAMIARLVDGTHRELGPLCYAGVIEMLDVHTEMNPDPPGTTGEETAEQRHLFGDGSLMIYTDTPAPMSVTHAGAMPDWQGFFPVQVAGVSNALCALYDPQRDILLGSACTDATDRALVPLGSRPEGDLLLTVTAFNRIPYTATVSVATNQTPPGTILRVR